MGDRLGPRRVSFHIAVSDIVFFFIVEKAAGGRTLPLPSVRYFGAFLSQHLSPPPHLRLCRRSPVRALRPPTINTAAHNPRCSPPPSPRAARHAPSRPASPTTEIPPPSPTRSTRKRAGGGPPGRSAGDLKRAPVLPPEEAEQRDRPAAGSKQEPVVAMMKAAVGGAQSLQRRLRRK